MRCPRPILPALVVRSVLGILLVLLTLPVVLFSPDPASAASETESLRVEIAEMTPAVLSGAEQVSISGTVTNDSDETWTSINVHAFHSQLPILDATTLAAAAELPIDAYVGDRVVEAGTFEAIPSLEPGDSASFTAVIPAGSLLGGDGVYWAGVHAIGQTDTQPRDEVTDGRARTFLPVVSGPVKPLPTALVMPLRAAVRYTPAGRVANPGQWAELLGTGGRLRNVLEAGTAAGGRPLTWLLDPAVVHAAWKLANGNPRVSLAPTPGTVEPEEAEETPTDDGEPPTPQAPDLTPPAPPTEESAAPNVDDKAAATAAQEWLNLLTSAIAEHPVLALPYGDSDASALAESSSPMLDLARAQSTALLDVFGIESTPVLAPPDGFLSPNAITATDDDTLILLSDQALQDPVGGLSPSSGQILGHTFATTSSGVAAGGPGPGPTSGAVAVRQRVVAEAALKMLAGDESPLIVSPPQGWDPATGAPHLFAALDSDLLRLKSLRTLVDRDAAEVDVSSLTYTEKQAVDQLPKANIRAANLLIDRAELLESVLTRPSNLVSQATEAALPSVSYFARRRSEEWVERNDNGISWLEQRLKSIRVETPLRATLSSDQGTLGVTVINDLDVSVTVQVRASATGGLQIAATDPLTVAPRARRRLRLAATATRQGTEQLTLRVTNAEEVPLGSSATYPVRTSQVSGILWVIMASGAIMLFGAIGVRLYRRVRANRREQAADGEAAEAGDAPGTTDPGTTDPEMTEAP